MSSEVTSEDAKAIADKCGALGVIILTFTDDWDGSDFTSYGNTQHRREKMEFLMEQLVEYISWDSNIW